MTTTSLLFTTTRRGRTSLLCAFLVVLTILASFQGYTILQEKGIIVNTNEVGKNSTITTTTTSIRGVKTGMISSAVRRSISTTTTSSSSLSPNSGQIIALNPDSALADDIVSIEHYTTERRVVVTLEEKAKCYRPYLIGRLNGPTLVKIDNWTYQRRRQQQQQQHAMIGAYQLPPTNMVTNSAPSTYRVEILALYCDHFLYDYLHQAQQDSDSSSAAFRHHRSLDFKNVCMEDPSHQRLTDREATVTVSTTMTDSIDVSPSSSSSLTWNGYWIHNEYNQQQQKRQHSQQQQQQKPRIKEPDRQKQLLQPIYTRYQPEVCYDGKSVGQQPPNMTQLHPECIQPTFNPIPKSYSFQWDPNTGGPIRRGMLRRPKPTHICLVGRSHSRTLIKASKMAGLTIRHQQLNIQYNWIQASFPENVVGNVTAFLNSNGDNGEPQQCDYLVLGVGQWPASYKRGSLLQDYHDGISNTIRELQSTINIPLVLRSIHYNPLSYPIASCPPQDWRNPVVIDGYNKVLKELAATHNVPYVDTNFIVGTIWDASPDWAHVDPTTSIKEILYLTATILGIEPQQQQQLQQQVQQQPPPSREYKG